MMKQKSLKLNFIMNAILTMSTFIFPLITFPYVSRILQPEGTGKVAMATSVITYFNMFAQLGIPTYGIRAAAKVRDNKEKLTRLAHELLFISLFMSTLTYFALAISLRTVSKFAQERQLYIIASTTIILTAIGMEWLYKGLEQYVYITVRSIIFKCIAVVAMFILVRQKSDYIIYEGLAIFAACASNIMNFINAHKYIGLKPVGRYRLHRHIKAIMVFFAMSCATLIYTNLDIFMLGFMTNDVEVGYYNASVRIKTLLVAIVTSLGAVLLPRCSYYIEHGLFDEFGRISKKALRFVFLLASPMSLYFIIYAKEGIFLLSGSAYGGSVIPMQIIMPTLLLIGITNILGIQILVPLGKEIIVLYSEIGGALTDLILNAILIPKLGSAGAAIGTVAAEAVVLIIQFIALRKEIIPAFKEIPYIRIIIALAISAAASIWLKGLSIPLFFILMFSACCFFGVYLIILLIFKEPLVMEIMTKVWEQTRRFLGKGTHRD